jgi:hypothetical protein
MNRTQIDKISETQYALYRNAERIADVPFETLAAAPELLDSLRELFGMIERGELVRDISADHKSDFALRMLEFVPKLNKAMLAIAKATGAK